jgi:tetraacyldisaccharide 4'-kinase
VLVVARTLEEGRLRGPVARALSGVWSFAAERTVVRPLPLPPRVQVVAVGGATLGGSGKTPLAIACARELALRGARVALVGHAYRARPGWPRLVEAGDARAQVGDEALLAARSLQGCGARVVVAPRRAQAVALAATLADVLVLDGVLQTAPVRASLSLLAVDAVAPWGSGSVPPCGDLRADVGALLGACDAVVPVGERGDLHDLATGAHHDSRGVWLEGALLSWEAVRGSRLGLASALARPERVLRFLARRGVHPVVVVRAADHGRMSARALAAHDERLDLWLATPKCALHLPGPVRAPLATVDHALVLSAVIRARLAVLAARAALLDPRGRQQ